MCTVTYVPCRDRVYLSSNRDEKQIRPDALAPALYSFPSGNILFPRDSQAGGTWIGVHENGNAMVLLNGAWKAHIPNPPYRRSRGLILLDLLSNPSPADYFPEMDLDRIEPFTVVILDKGELYESRWDGTRRFRQKLDRNDAFIWSSSTLYDEGVVQKRAGWFSSWRADHPSPGWEDILHFHQFTGEGDPQNDLRMHRPGQVATVSVTSVKLQAGAAYMRYLDIRNQIEKEERIHLQSATVSNP